MEQNEIDQLMSEIKVSDGPAPESVDGGKEGGGNGGNGGDGGDLGWEDVQAEMEMSRAKAPKLEAQEMQFEELKKGEPSKSSLDIDFILDIPLSVNVELGRTRLLISELLQLGQGSVIELTKLAGEPMDIYINQRLIARGEVVVVNEKFGIRLTDIISPAERISKLR
jgi:flagellar motor switch protein FliN/FliY